MRRSSLLLFALLFAFGCGDSGGVAPGGTGGTGTGGTSDGGDGGTGASDGGTGGDAGSDMGEMPAPELSLVEDVLYVGRFDDSDPGEVLLSWSGSGFVIRFRGTSAQATFRGGRLFTVVVDGEEQPAPLEVSNDVVRSYDLATDLPDGEHTIEVYRRTEAANGPTVVGAVVVDGEPLSVSRPTRQLEIVGDSWSTGVAVDDANGLCDFRSEDHFASWGSIAARALDAELSTVAWGGRGVIRGPMSEVYDRVVGTEAGSTGTIRPVDAVLVSLGANDFTDGELPSEFVSGYVALLEQIRRQHPDALIGCIWPELPDASETAIARAAIDEAVAERVTAGDDQVMGAALELEELVDLACDDYHPGAETHALMADKTIAFLKAELGW
ncbi:MAG: SGNH/GDSL hydrolase family protein [Myxococcota bacterium]